jgi:hypothetical protein
MGSLVKRPARVAGLVVFIGVIVVLMFFWQRHKSQRTAVPRAAVHYNRSAVVARAIAALASSEARDGATQEVVAALSEEPAPVGPRYKKRLPGEWDGMLVDMAVQPECVDEMRLADWLALVRVAS